MKGIWNLIFAAALAIGFLGTQAAMGQNAQANGAASQQTNTNLPKYDLSQEIRVQGTIEKIDNSGGMAPLGAHLLIQTAQGTVDAHLGALTAASQKALGLSEGESVTLTGMMENLGGNSVLLARILQTPSNMFFLRTLTGMPVRSLIPRGHSASVNREKGGL